MSDFNVTTELRDDTAVVRLQGRLTLGGSQSLRTAIDDLLKKGVRKFIWELEGVPLVDSAGMGEIFGSMMRIDRAGGNVVMVHVGSKIKNLFDLTKMLSVTPMAEDETKAQSLLDEYAGKSLLRGWAAQKS